MNGSKKRLQVALWSSFLADSNADTLSTDVQLPTPNSNILSLRSRHHQTFDVENVAPSTKTFLVSNRTPTWTPSPSHPTSQIHRLAPGFLMLSDAIPFYIVTPSQKPTTTTPAANAALRIQKPNVHILFLFRVWGRYLSDAWHVCNWLGEGGVGVSRWLVVSFASLSFIVIPHFVRL
jgi:hypothetical protein